MRQSNSLSVNSWAMTRSDSSNMAASIRSSSSRFRALTTPREKEESGSFSTTGNPSMRAASPVFSLWRMRVIGWGMRLRAKTSARDLVAAPHDGGGVVDDHEPLGLGLAGEAVG